MQLARFLTQPTGAVTRTALITTMREHIPSYTVMNGIEVSGLLGRLVNMVDGRHQEIMEELNLEDEDSEGVLPFEKIIRYWNYSGYPKLDAKLVEFLELMALRVSSSLREVNYREFAKIFDPDFQLERSYFEDDVPFVADRSDSDDLMGNHEDGKQTD